MSLFGPPDIAKLAVNTDVKRLIAALNYQKDPAVRAQAAQALGNAGDPLAVEPLVTCLADQDRNVRQCAVAALGDIGDAGAVQPLIAALSDGWTRWLAINSLGEIADPTAVRPVIAALGDADVAVRKAAVKALGKFGDPAAVIALLGFVADPDRDIRTDAIEALESLGALDHARVIQALVAALTTEPRNFSATAPRGSFAPRDALVKAGASAVPDLIAALQDVDVSVRRAAAEVLGMIGDQRARDPLSAALQDPHADVRRSAAESLDQLGWHSTDAGVTVPFLLAQGKWQECVEIGADAVGPLCAALRSPDYWVREAAASALGEIGDRRAAEPLVGVLTDRGEQLRVRGTAAEALGKIGDPLAVEPLLAALVVAPTDPGDSYPWDEDEEMRKASASALGHIGDPAVGPLIDAVRGWNRLERMRSVAAFDALGWQPDMNETGAVYWAAKRQWNRCTEIGVPAVEPLIQILPTHYVNDREGAAEALGEIGDARAVEPLLAILSDVDEGGRRVAVEALGRIGDARAVPALAAAVDDRDAEVGEAAARALQRMGVPPTAGPISATEEMR